MADGAPQRRDVMSVYRRRAHDAQLLEQHGVGHNELLQRFLGGFTELHHGLAGNTQGVLHKVLHVVAVFAVVAVHAQRAKVHCHSADVAGNAHLVIVQDDNERRLRLTDVVKRLECHTARKGGIAD